MSSDRGLKARSLRRPGIGLLTVAFVLVGFLSVGDQTSPGILPEADAWTIVRPSVLWCGIADSTATIEAHIVGRTDVVSARVAGPNESFPLYDDGSHGDVLAGDRVFTAGGVYPFCHTGLSLKYGMTVGGWSGTLEVTLADGSTLVDDRSIHIGLVQPRYRGKSAIVDYQDGLSATAYAFFIQDIDGVVFDGYPVARADQTAIYRKALSMLYSILPDAFDLVVIMPGRTLFHADSLSEITAQSTRVANDAQHIGIHIFNDAATYGSAGRLREVIFQPFGSIGLIDSEIASLWGADLGAPVGLAAASADGTYLWDPMSDVGGQLSSYFISDDGSLVGRFASNGDGTWRLVSPAENERYSPIELYAMGLLPATEVPPMHLLAQVDLTSSDRITASSVQTVSIDDVVAAQGGVRFPSPEESQKSFHVAFVIVQEAPFTDADYAYYSFLSYHLMTRDTPADFDDFAPFYWATGGRATLNTRLPIDVTPILPPP